MFSHCLQGRTPFLCAYSSGLRGRVALLFTSGFLLARSFSLNVSGREEVLTPIDAEAVEAARAEELPEAHLLLLVETFQALADPTRARILYVLIQRPVCSRSRYSRRRISVRCFTSTPLFTGSPSGQIPTRRQRHLLSGGRSPCGCSLQRG